MRGEEGGGGGGDERFLTVIPVYSFQNQVHLLQPRCPCSQRSSFSVIIVAEGLHEFGRLGLWRRTLHLASQLSHLLHCFAKPGGEALLCFSQRGVVPLAQLGPPAQQIEQRLWLKRWARDL